MAGKRHVSEDTKRKISEGVRKAAEERRHHSSAESASSNSDVLAAHRAWAAESLPVATLFLMDADGSETSLEVRDSPITIGRSDKCGLSLAGAGVSSMHCRIEIVDDSLRAVDLDSTNGTYLNAVRITNAPLVDGDVIECGGIQIRVGIGSSKGPEVALRQAHPRGAPIAWPIVLLDIIAASAAVVLGLAYGRGTLLPRLAAGEDIPLFLGFAALVLGAPWIHAYQRYSFKVNELESRHLVMAGGVALGVVGSIALVLVSDPGAPFVIFALGGVALGAYCLWGLWRVLSERTGPVLAASIVPSILLGAVTVGLVVFAVFLLVQQAASTKRRK